MYSKMEPTTTQLLEKERDSMEFLSSCSILNNSCLNQDPKIYLTMATKDVGGLHDKAKTGVHFAYYDPPVIDLQPPRSEGTREKLVRKTKENPFVPLGLSVTVFALIYGIYQLKTGNSLRSQKLMRLRVGAQSFTIVALLGGLVYEARKQSKSAPPT